MADFDLDGDLDLACADDRIRRGPAADVAVLPPFWRPYAQPNELPANDGGGGFASVAALNPAACGTPNVARPLLLENVAVRRGRTCARHGSGAMNAPAAPVDEAASRRKWRWTSVAFAVAATGGLIVLLAALRWPRSGLPGDEVRSVDPQVQSLYERSRATVRAQPESAPAWGDLAELPDHALASPGLSRVLLASGAPDEAATALAPALTHPATRRAAHELLARIEGRRGDEPAALVTGHPEIALLLQGREFLARGDPRRAEEVFRAALAHDVRSIEAAHALGTAIAAQGRRDEAADVFRSVIAVEPSYVRAWRDLADCLEATDPAAAREARAAAAAYARGMVPGTDP